MTNSIQKLTTLAALAVTLVTLSGNVFADTKFQQNHPRRAQVNARLNNQNLSYFAGLDAGDSSPRRLLDGDRNLTGETEPENGILKLTPGETVSWTAKIHVNAGNVGLADGSVQQCSNAGLQSLLKNSGSPTNTWRLALPQ